jgi:hypothetical protein
VDQQTFAGDAPAGRRQAGSPCYFAPSPGRGGLVETPAGCSGEIARHVQKPLDFDPLNLRPELTKLFIDHLVPAVDMVDAVDFCCSVG